MKELIKQRFSKSLKTYQTNAKIQKKMATKLVDYVPLKRYDNVLELGCGTGFLTNVIHNNVEYTNYDAVDIVDGCGEYVKLISEDINFVCGDIEKIEYSKQYDLIVSNATLQWLEDLKGFVKKLDKMLVEDGILAITLFGEQNFCELSNLIENQLFYYSIDGIRELFKDFDVITINDEIYTMEFSTPKDVLYHIKNTGVNAISPIHWTKRNLMDFESKYLEACDGRITLTYNPIYIVCKKK